jgi:hypothetical protein
MDKAARTRLIVMVAVFAALLVLALAQTLRIGTPQPSEESAVQSVFPQLVLNDITAIRLRQPSNDREFVMQRDDDGAWSAVTPAGTLDPEVAETIAITPILIPYYSTVTVLPEADLTQYGFNPNGVLRMEILLVDGTAHGLAVGGLTPSRDTYYAFVDDRPELFVVERRAVDYLLTILQNPPVTSA